MARNVRFELRRGAGSSLEVLYGKVSLRPTLMHNVASSVVLPAPTTFDLINGIAIATNVAPSPDPVDGMVEWAYVVKVEDNHCKTFEFMVGVPDGTTEINFNELPRYFETKPPLFGRGPQGVPGEAATIEIGAVDAGPTPAVTNTGTSTDAVLNFTLARGPQGPKGDGTFNEYNTRNLNDPPNAYPTGFIAGLYGTTMGWPFSPFSHVSTFSMSYGPAKVQLITPYSGATGEPMIRVAKSSTEWGPTEPLRGGLATPLLNGLMPALDKAKLDGMTPTANSKTFAAAASSYQAGFSVLQVRAADGWPIPTTGTVVTQKNATGNGGVGQWLYPVEGGAPQYRVSDAVGNWLPFATLASESSVAGTVGALRVTNYPTVQDALDDAATRKLPLVIDSDITATDVNNKIYSVELEGKGSITVGGNKFWVNPQHLGIQTNTLYIDPTLGNDLNSGIDPAAPIKTFSRLNINLTMLREKLLDGFWEIVLKAGTHVVTQGWRMDGLRTKWPLKIRGEGTNASIIDGGSDIQGKAIYFKHFETSVEIDNIRFQNYQGVGDGIDTSAGILVQGPGNLRVTNCTFVDTTTGIHLGYAASGTFLSNTFLGSQVRSISSSITSGIVVLYGASATIGTSLATRNTFNKCVQGVHVTRNAVAHVDYNYHLDCYYGLKASHNARIAVLDGDFLRNVVAIDMTGGSECTFAKANFGLGTSNANTAHNVRFQGTAKFTQYQGAYPSAVEYRLYGTSYVPPLVVASGTSNTLVNAFPSTASIPAGVLHGLNKKIKFRVEGSVFGTGSRTMKFTKNDRTGSEAQDLVSITIPSGYTGHFTLEMELYKSSYDGNFRTTSRLEMSDQLPIVSQGYTSGLNLDHDWLFRMYKTDSVVALDTSIFAQEIYVLG